MEERKVNQFAGGHMSQFWEACGAVIIFIALIAGIVLAQQTVVRFGSYTETKFNIWILLGILASGAVTSCGCFTLSSLLNNQQTIIHNQTLIAEKLGINIEPATEENTTVAVDDEENNKEAEKEE